MPVLQANNDILAFLSGMPVTRNTKYLDLKNSVSQKSLPAPLAPPQLFPVLVANTSCCPPGVGHIAVTSAHSAVQGASSQITAPSPAPHVMVRYKQNLESLSPAPRRVALAS